MKFCKGIVYITLITMIFAVAGCGGGGGSAGNATLAMTLSAPTIAAGGSLSSEAKLTATGTHPVNELPITYTSSRPDLIHFAQNTATNYGNSTITIDTNLTGAVYVVINVDNTVAIPAAGIDVAITATSQGLTATQQLKVTAIPGSGTTPVGGTSVQMALSKAAIQDNGDQAIATATVRDAAGSPLANQAVAFTISPTSGPAVAVPISGGVTDSSGRAFATITGTTTTLAQTVFVYATVSGVSTAQPLTINPTTVTTPTSNPKNIAMTFGKTILQASEQTILTATVTDGTNQPVNNQTVAFTSQPLGSHVTVTPINSGLTDSTGKAYAVITAGIAASTENIIIYATAGASPNTVTSSAPIVVLPPSATSSTLPASNISMTPSAANIQPDGQAVITTKVTDSTGAVVPNEVVTFSVISGPITVSSPASPATGGDGTCLAIVQASAATNPTYALLRASTANGVTQTIAIGILPSGKPQITLTIAKPVIDASDQEVLATVEVKDSTGSPVNGQSVTFTKVSGPFNIDPALTTGTTGADGKFSTKLTPTGTPFAANILLSVQLTYGGTSYTLVATALVNPAVNLTVALDSATVDTIGQLIATATATTASGVPLPNQVVVFTVTGPGTIVGQNLTTATDGTAKALITHDATTNIGNVIVEAAITIGGTTYRAYATAIPKAANMNLTLSVQSGFTPTFSLNAPLGTLTDFTTTTVDGLTAALPIKAKFTYIDGTPVPNHTVTFTALDPGLFWNSAGGGVNGASVTATTTTSGEAYAVAVPGNFSAAGFIHIQASTTINGATYTQVMPIAVQPRQLEKTFTLDKQSLVISPNESAIVNGQYSLKDLAGNELSNIPVTFSIISGPATITGPATVATDGAGNASVLVVAGPNILRRESVYVNAAVTVNGMVFNTVSSFTVDPSVKLSLTTDLAQVGPSGGQVVATATLTDSARDAISGQNVTFSILTPVFASITSAPTVATSSNGAAVANIQTLATNSTQNVLVQVSTTYAGATFTEITTFQITGGVGSLVVTSPETTSSTAKAPASSVWLTVISVTLLDSNGNPRPNIPVTLSAAASDRPGYEVATAPNTYALSHTVSTDSLGVATFTTITPALTVNAAGAFDSSQVVWRAQTNDPIPLVGYSASTYELTGN